MADKKKDKVNVRDLKPNKDAKGGIGRYAQGAGGAKHAQGAGGARHAQGAGGPRGAN